MTGLPYVPLAVPRARPASVRRRTLGEGGRGAATRRPVTTASGGPVPRAAPYPSGSATPTPSTCGRRAPGRRAGHRHVRPGLTGAERRRPERLADSVPVQRHRPGPVRRDDRASATTPCSRRPEHEPGLGRPEAGRTLPPSDVDGWRQAWHLDAGGREVTAVFAPDRIYRCGLLRRPAPRCWAWSSRLRRGRRWRRADPHRGMRAPHRCSCCWCWRRAAAGCSPADRVRSPPGSWLVATAHAAAPGRRCAVFLAAVVLPAAGAYVIRPWGDTAGWAGSLAWPQLPGRVGLLAAVRLAAPEGATAGGGHAAGQGFSTTR